MKFIDRNHKEFCEMICDEMGNFKRLDCYDVALIYTLSVCETTRKHFDEIFDLKEGINIDSLKSSWQTGTSLKVTRMAFNLYNNCMYDSEEDIDKGQISEYYNPSDIFACSYAKYFFEAIKIIYPEYTKIEENDNIGIATYMRVGKKEQLRQDRVVAQYIRIGLLENTTGLELLSQKQVLDDYCKEKYDVLKVYIDKGFSGLDKERPELNRMIEDLKKGKIDVIVVKDLSRLFRNSTDLIAFLESDFMKHVEIDSLDNSVEDFKKLIKDNENEDEEEILD